MQVSAFFDGLRDAFRRLGSSDGDTSAVIRMHPLDWNELTEAIGPPWEFFVAQAQEHGGQLRPKLYPSGEVMGLFQDREIHSDEEVPRHFVYVLHNGKQLTIGAGPFPPAEEPEGGWKMARPLFLPHLNEVDDVAHARTGDPETSHAAAASIASDKIRASQQAILRVLHEHGPSTDVRLVLLYGQAVPRQSSSGLRTRRSELVAKGLVYDTGRREVLLPSGRKAIVWAAK